jgi:C_GCAxxG_C_C family probable redox protein
MMNKSEIAAGYMKSGYNCAQAIMRTYAGWVGMKEEDAIRMASVLGGGIGRNGHICGAVSAAALIIGMKYGTIDPLDFPAKEKAYNRASDLLEQFRAVNKSILCRDLIGYDMKNQEELRKAREAGIFQEKCPLFVASAARILENILKAG